MERLGNSSSFKCVSSCARHSSAAPKYGTKLSRNRSNSDPSKQPQIPRICYDRSCCSSAALRGSISNSHHPDATILTSVGTGSVMSFISRYLLSA
eukprot:scaffold289810_cov31-Attheya_sp.AAC.1